MTDIDFDELDRAVNSLMQQHKDETESPADPAETPSNSSPVGNIAVPDPAVESTEPVAKPVASVPDTSVATSTTPTIPQDASHTNSSTAPSLATKRTTGRFMDVVHPSSDMMSSHVNTIRPRTSRVGVSLQPSSDITPPVDNLDQTEQSASDTVEVAETPVQDTVQPPVTDSYENPSDQSQPESSSTPETELNEAMSKLMEQELSETPQAPLETPFVQGAVVDKRPLGGAPVDVSDVAKTDDTPSSSDLSDEATESIEPASVQTLAPELDRDLMALESSDPETSPDLVEAPVEPVESVEASEPAPEQTEIKPEEVQSSNTVPNNSTVQAVPVAGDIPQQYAAQPDTDPQPEPMYDAAAESPELAHKEKKKSGWLTVVLILLLLVVGAAGGAAIWYFLL